MLDGDRLAGFGVFASLTPEQRGAIASRCAVHAFGPGEEIFAQGSVAARFYGLLDGEAELVLRVTERVLKSTIDYEEALTVEHETLERSIVVEVLRGGDVFGWSSLLSPPGTLTASARCRGPVTAFSAPGDALLELFEREPELGYRFMQRLVTVISQRLRHRTEKLSEAWVQAFDSHSV